MTSRELFNGLLTELSKHNAPSMLLLDFNYFLNKSIQLYTNKRYNIYDVNQQTTDDLRVLKASTYISDPKQFTEICGHNISDYGAGNSKLFGGTYYINLPLDYLHMLNCVCVYELDLDYNCYSKGDVVQFAAKRLTGDSWSVVMNDYYNRPLPERPYFYINNVNQSNDLPTNPRLNTSNLTRTSIGTDKPNKSVTSFTRIINGIVDTLPICYLGGFLTDEVCKDTEFWGATIESLPRLSIERFEEIIKLLMDDSNRDSQFDINIIRSIEPVYTESLYPTSVNLLSMSPNNLVNKEAGERYGNTSSVRCEIRYGLDSSVFRLIGVIIDYIKTPLHIKLTQQQVNLTQDTSLVMEFPDYVCWEIINELVHLVMENTADPRLQTHAAVTQSIANPTTASSTTTK